MRILVFSDSHQRTHYFKDALLMHPEANMIIHLGDGEHDLDYLSPQIGNIPVVAVRGNCDMYSPLPDREIAFAAGKKIYCTHGHLDSVRIGESRLVENAKKAGAQIALYGHTHKQSVGIKDGVYVMNPGAVAQGYYGMIDIIDGSIMLLPCRVER